jgi:hypothetical protein
MFAKERNALGSFIRTKANLMLYFYVVLLPSLTFLFLPISGLGNGGHCDTWYYWGMARSPLIAESTFEIGYYPASRVLNYTYGWFLPLNSHPILITRLIPSILLAIILLYSLRRNGNSPTKTLFLGALFLSPYVLSQMSTSYAQVPLFLGFLLAISANKAKRDHKGYFAVGFFLTSLFLSNANFIFATAPFGLYLVLVLIKRKKIRVAMLGALTGLVIPSLILFTNSNTRNFAMSYPFLQFNSIKPYLLQRTQDFDLVIVFTQLIKSQTLSLFVLLLAINLLFKTKNRQKIESNQLSILLLAQICWQFIMTLLGKGDFFTIGYASIATMILVVFFLLETIDDSSGAKFEYSLFVIFAIYLISNILFQDDLFFSAFEIYSIRYLIPLLTILLLAVVLRWRSNFRFRDQTKIPIILWLVCFSTFNVTDYSYVFMHNAFNRLGTPTKVPISIETGYISANEAIAFAEKTFYKNGSVGFASIESKDQLLNSYIRAATRSSATCGMDWSNLNNNEVYPIDRTKNWPDNVLLIKDHRDEFSELNFPGFELLDRKTIRLEGYLLDFLAFKSKENDS